MERYELVSKAGLANLTIIGQDDDRAVSKIPKCVQPLMQELGVWVWNGCKRIGKGDDTRCSTKHVIVTCWDLGPNRGLLRV